MFDLYIRIFRKYKFQIIYCAISLLLALIAGRVVAYFNIKAKLVGDISLMAFMINDLEVFLFNFLIIIIIVVIGLYLFHWLNKFGFKIDIVFVLSFTLLLTFLSIEAYETKGLFLSMYWLSKVEIMNYQPFVGELIDNSVAYLKVHTIFNFPADLFVSKLICAGMLFLSIIYIVYIFVNLVKVIFRNKEENNLERLHFFISAYMITLFALSFMFVTVLYWFSKDFNYEFRNVYLLFFDAFYYACTIWVGGSTFETNTLISKIIQIIITFANLMFFIIFLTGLFISTEESIHRVEVKKITKIRKKANLRRIQKLNKNRKNA